LGAFAQVNRFRKGEGDMILFVRSVRTIRGKRGEAKKWAIELTDYINAQCPDIKCKVFIPRFGEMNWIYWITEFETLTDLDAWQQKIASDEGYHKLSLQAQHLFTQDSIEDKVLTSLV